MDPSPIKALTSLALAGGTFVGRPSAQAPTSEPEPRKDRRFSAKHGGFDVHCAVRVAADDDEGRERLVRCCARPPFARGRIEELQDGRIAYRMKTARRGSTHRVMSPVEFLARLAILLPPPYFPLVRYRGVFAPRSTSPARVTRPSVPMASLGRRSRRRRSRARPSDRPLRGKRAWTRRP